MIKKIYASQLFANISTNNVYLLHGGDILLSSEASDSLLEAAHKDGFTDKLKHNLKDVDFVELQQNLQTMSLFGNKKIVELHLGERLLAADVKKIEKIISLLHQDIFLILSIEKLTKTIEAQSWFINLSKNFNFITVNCQSLNLAATIVWIKTRIKFLHLNLDDDAIEYLSFQYENNLLALKHSLVLLQSLYADEKKMHNAKKLSLNIIRKHVEQSSIFTQYQWVDALFEGKIKRALVMLESFALNEFAPLTLIRTLQKELFTLGNILSNSKLNFNNAISLDNFEKKCQELNIWQSKQRIYKSFLYRSSTNNFFNILLELSKIEVLAKTSGSSDLYVDLKMLSLLFEG